MIRRDYSSYSSEKLINKVNTVCDSNYLNSKIYAALREALLRRIKTLKYRNDTLKPLIWLKNIKDRASYYEVSQARELFFDYAFEFTREEVLLSKDYEVNKFFKQLYKKLQTALNKLDKCWGWYGVVGYGLNYGSNHIETNHTTSKQMAMMIDKIKELQIDKAYLLKELKE